MVLAQARRILAVTPKDRTQKQRLFRGIAILANYDEDICYSFRSEQLFCADFATTVVQMSEEEVEAMARLGWFESEDAWSLLS